ncbi:L,D-transpeptidase [Actinomyces urogenitalis]|uniref:L,D-TPase catalytic domain-containing protein n=1 Tax=Actinomyces urogenitalis TaxID=103621 RepID=A0A2I1KRH4_9ACTO|nr:L,D-transpeptidase [Actinomyces urogenitalis]MBS5977349.1 L,D-transpeptidase [Actinomyces urogenitalis]MDU0864108.1 L,D-transpeptidase [Actinomyces urogenitalis]MDU0874729.1 L,D-transpeptidase [Actinomyces urogenitalis]MDU1564132.1 L,D-transpeptidase [Actinomyces urogenitalis]MDU1639777.1 L,D-transpeptidase [Actinomyces urogenitalis]
MHDEETVRGSGSSAQQAGTSTTPQPALPTPYSEQTSVRRTSVFGAQPASTGASTGGDTESLPAVPAAAQTAVTPSPSAPSPQTAAAPMPAAVPPATSQTSTLRSAATPAVPAPAPETESPSEPADGDGERTARSHRSERKKRWPLWTAAAALLLLGVSGAGGYAYASHYADTAVPGTSVGGVDVSGKTREQIVELVSKRAQDAAVTISGDVEATASLEDLGTTIDAEATADAAMARSADVLDRFKALVTDNNVAVVTTANADTAASYAASLVPEDQAKAVDATVTLAADGASFTTTPAADGTGLDPAPLESTAAKAAQTLSSQTVELSYTTVAPTVSDADAQAAADKANGLVGLDVTVATTDASSSFTADAPTKASWITIKPGQDSKPAVSVDAAKVGEWVAAQSAQVSKDPVTGQRNVNSRGEVVATRVEAVNGVVVSNSEDLTSAITQSLTEGKAYSGSFVTSEVEASWEDRTIADGAENLIYQAAPGEKWVNVNLAAKTVTAYEGATVVRGPVSIVDGAAETPTITGTFKVYLQYASQTMRGNNVDGSRYVTPDVPWVSYFQGGYAFHGAPWRSSFGYSGSHGCINMPVSEAKWIYDWAEIGTTVVSHY